jgi:hypothetical protein
VFLGMELSMDQTADIRVVLDDVSTHATPEAWE